jgi:hypothetical protein
MEFTLADHFKLLEEFPAGTWLTISTRENRVLSTNPDAKEAMDESRAQGEEHPLIMRVPLHNGLRCF